VREAVKDDVNTLTVRVGKDLISVGRCPGIVYVLDAHRAQTLLFGTAGGRTHLCTRMPCKLNGRHADATTGSVDEYSLPGGRLCPVESEASSQRRRRERRS